MGIRCDTISLGKSCLHLGEETEASVLRVCVQAPAALAVTPPAAREHAAVTPAGFDARLPGQPAGPTCGAGAEAVPCLTKVWLVSRRISQPSIIMRSMARFFRMFSVSLTSSCIILGTGRSEGGCPAAQGGPAGSLARPGKEAWHPILRWSLTQAGSKRLLSPAVCWALHRHDSAVF